MFGQPPCDVAGALAFAAQRDRRQQQRGAREEPVKVNEVQGDQPGAASENTANSLSAGLAEACVIRRRRRVATMGASRRIKRRGPMLVDDAMGSQESDCQRSTVNASMRCP